MTWETVVPGLLLDKVVQWVSVLLVAPVTFVLIQAAKHASAWFDALPAWSKRGAAVFVSTVLTGLFAAIQLYPPCVANAAAECTFADLSPDVLEQVAKALLGAVGAMAIHSVRAGRRRR